MPTLRHIDMGPGGSQFLYKHPPLKSRTLFGLLLCCLLTVFFCFGLHLLDLKILSALCIVLVVSLLMKLHIKVQSESVLILPSLGIQVTTHFILGRESKHFIYLPRIKDVVINEAIYMHAVMYYLVVLIQDPKSRAMQQLCPLFTHSWPCLDQLTQVFVVAQEKLALNRTTS